jgi:hypothetical protein
VGIVNETKEAWVDWILERIPEPISFLTLTYEHEVHPQQARSNLEGLIRVLNEDALGKDYQEKVKHCYFSYVFVLEYQKRGVAHWHGIVDSWINYDLVHRWWPASCGFAWIEKVNHPKNFRSGGSVEGAIRYLAKYLTKGTEDAEVWFSEKKWEKTPSGLIALASEALGEPVKVEERATKGARVP